MNRRRKNGEENQLITVGFRAALFSCQLSSPRALLVFVLHRRISFDLATLIESIVSQLGQFRLALWCMCASTALSVLLKMQTTTTRVQVPSGLLGDRLRFTHTEQWRLYSLALCFLRHLGSFCLFFRFFPLRANAFSLFVCMFSLNLLFLQLNGTEK